MCPLRYLVALLSLLLMAWAAASLLWLPEEAGAARAGALWRDERTWVRGAAQRSGGRAEAAAGWGGGRHCCGERAAARRTGVIRLGIVDRREATLMMLCGAL